MAKRWTRKDDGFLHFYADVGDAILDYMGQHDLGRPAGAAKRRIAFLKSCGAWSALDRIKAAERDYRLSSGNVTQDDVEGLSDHPAPIAAPGLRLPSETPPELTGTLED